MRVSGATGTRTGRHTPLMLALEEEASGGRPVYKKNGGDVGGEVRSGE